MTILNPEVAVYHKASDNSSVWIETRDKTTFVVWHSGTAIKCYGSFSQAQAYVDTL